MSQENYPLPDASSNEPVAEDLFHKHQLEARGRVRASGVKRIGVLTSGGDAPGMNALVRGVVRTATYYGVETYGVKRGYHGLWKGDIQLLTARDVSDILQKGGTFLVTTRSDTFTTEEGIQKALAMIDVFNLDCVVCIGGDGTWRGAADLAAHGANVLALPATIDNDIDASEYSIGYDTALNTALDSVDKLKDTASALERCSVVEVMGRDRGYLALSVGIASGAEIILTPERRVDFMDDVVGSILSARNRGKTHFVVILAEGACALGNAQDLAANIEKYTGIESRATNLGYVQRGGSPSLRDRYMASLMAVHGVRTVLTGRRNRAVVFRQGEIQDVDIQEALTMKKSIAEDLFTQADILSF